MVLVSRSFLLRDDLITLFFLGKNDGMVMGTRYFTCEPRHGVFSRLFRQIHRACALEFLWFERALRAHAVILSIVRFV